MTLGGMLPFVWGLVQVSDLVIKVAFHRKPVQRLVCTATDVGVVHVRCHHHPYPFMATPDNTYQLLPTDAGILNINPLIN